MNAIRTAVASSFIFLALAAPGAKAQPAPTTDEAQGTSAKLTREELKLGSISLEMQVPKGVNRKLLVSQLPVRSASASDSEYMQALAEGFDRARQLLYPEAQIALTLTRDGGAPSTRSTTGTVDLYKRANYWNWSAGAGGYVYAYNYYVNTVMCIIDPASGSWDAQIQNNGSWTYFESNMLADGISTASGADNYKGCYFSAKASSNKANLHYYFYN